jgi:hypothetical protein
VSGFVYSCVRNRAVFRTVQRVEDTYHRQSTLDGAAVADAH